MSKAPKKLNHRHTAICLAALALFAGTAGAQETTCNVQDRACITATLQGSAAGIETAAWRDQVYRELAKTLAADGHTDEAIALIDKIETPDTKAMTIRGIGMAVADKKMTKAEYDPVFHKLRQSANKITHPPSFAIALTYIAMGQAFAGDNEGAWKTASEMENEALRHKAYGETAEIQAENGNFEAVKKTIGLIGSPSYRNKSSNVIVKILADKKMLAEALTLAEAITDPYKKAESLQYVLDAQKPREISHEKD